MDTRITHNNSKITRKDRQAELFVTEFVKDFNIKAAALRMGFEEWQASSKGSTFYNSPDVQKRIREWLDEKGRESFYTRERIMARLWEEANYYGRDASPSARVRAAEALAKMAGMEMPQKVDVTMHGGVMLVPAMGTTAEWTEAAAKAQQKLKEDVRE